jgi:histidinol dehydrogenase
MASGTAATARSFATRGVSIASRRRSKSPRLRCRRPRHAVDPSIRLAIARAASHIARVAFRQLPRHFDLTIAPGVSIEQRAEPLASVGCYVPGAAFPLPSSLLMTAVPARVAGVRDIVVVCPRPDDVVMAAAVEAGATRLFRVGGGAMRLRRSRSERRRYRGWTRSSDPATATSRRPRRWSPRGARSIFMPVRPKSSSSRDGAASSWIAADLVAQAEHDPEARAIFITWSRALAKATAAAGGAMSASRPAGAPGARVARRRCRRARRRRSA